MCKAIQDLMADSRAEGRVEGRMEGRAEEKREMIRNYLLSGGTEEDAMRMLKVTKEDIAATKQAVS